MSLYEAFRHSLADEQPVVLATVVGPPEHAGAKLLVRGDGTTEGDLPTEELRDQAVVDALALLRVERSETREYHSDGEHFDVFFDVYPGLARLIIVGASHAAAPLTRLAKLLGFHVTVTDARAAFALPGRFPEADAVLKGWPQDVLPSLRLDASTYVVLLSHDSRFDQPTLEIVLPTDVPYIGAIGSRKTQRERMERLSTEGHGEDQLSRVYGPVGLDLGGRSAEETALAIMAEIVAVRRGGSGGFMRRRMEAGTPA